MKLFSILLAVLISSGLAFATGASSSGQQPGQSSEQMQGAQGMQTSDILNDIHRINQTEMQLAKLGEKHAQAKDVKQMAKDVSQSHKQNDKKLEQLSKQEKIELKGYQASMQDKAQMDELKKLKGAQFDQAFVRAMDDGHKMAIRTLSEYESQATNPAVKDYISNTLTSIKGHSQTISKMPGAESSSQSAGEVDKSEDMTSSSSQ